MKGMKVMFSENIKMSWQNIINNKMRSFLTILGIVIGVTAIIALISIVQGVIDESNRQFMGMGTGKITVQAFGTPLKQGLTFSDIERISEIENFGTKTATAIVKGLADIREDFNKILSLGVVLKEKVVDEDGVLYGKNIIFTGTMQNKGRKQMEEEAENKGASIQKSVTKKTDMLIYGKKAGSKLEKAKKLGVECFTEEEYMKLVN